MKPDIINKAHFAYKFNASEGRIFKGRIVCANKGPDIKLEIALMRDHR